MLALVTSRTPRVLRTAVVRGLLELAGDEPEFDVTADLDQGLTGHAVVMPL
jgi:hypothetical protein